LNSRTYIQARIAATKAQIEAFEAAVLSFADSAQQSYRLDTGQSVVQVTRADLLTLNKTIDTLYSRLAGLEARLNGASVTVQPGW
jgi:hypothetical protein